MICSLICKIVYRFGEEIVEKMRDWAVEYVPPSGKPRILDVGSGNGNLLFSLSEAGYDDELLVGIDYSMDAVRLAQSIASTRNAEGGEVCLCRFFTRRYQVTSRAGGDR